MASLTCILLSAGLIALPRGSAQVDQPRLTIAFNDGRVSIVAENTTVQQIFTEWARTGRTRIVNADRLAGLPVTVHLFDVPEAAALDTLLRSASGHLATYRSVRVHDVSSFERIAILPTSKFVAPPPAMRRPSVSVVPQPSQTGRPIVAADEQERPDGTSSAVRGGAPASWAPTSIGNAAIGSSVTSGQASDGVSAAPSAGSAQGGATGETRRFRPLTPWELAAQRLNRQTVEQRVSVAPPPSSPRPAHMPHAPQSSAHPGVPAAAAPNQRR